MISTVVNRSGYTPVRRREAAAPDVRLADVPLECPETPASYMHRKAEAKIAELLTREQQGGAEHTAVKALGMGGGRKRS